VPVIINNLLGDFWKNLHLSAIWTERFNNFLSLILLVVIILIIAKLSSFIFTTLFKKIIVKTKTIWDDKLMESGFFFRLSRLVPAIFAYFLLPAFLMLGSHASEYARRLILAYIAGMSAHICAAFLNGIHLIYQHDAAEAAKKRPIKSYVQLAQIFLYIIGGILVVTTIMNVSPTGILSALGAMSAVLMLVFKDSILGFVSSMQLAGNDMVRLGDWIEMPSYNADGNVIDITLQSVKVQNWDNTISTIPVYALISDSFKNWRGMSDSGGRRIKCSLHIDKRSVAFLSAEQITRLSGLRLLSDYMKTKLAEIAEFNKTHGIAEGDYVSGRHLTNLGTYRAYTEAYLHALPNISQTMTNMVRYLPPDGRGLRMEIYLFSADTNWVNYERIQADILDHLLATLPEFGLRVFQDPSGNDLQAIADSIETGIAK
jgi:miniconductance mechanosensitive channel